MRLTARTLLLLLAWLPLAGLAQSPAVPERFAVPIYFFWGDGCPHCATQKVFLEQLKADHPNVVVYDFEVYYVEENRSLMTAMAAAFGRTVTGVPMTFIGDEVWVGYNDAAGRQMRAAVERYETYAAPDPVDRVAPELRERFVPPSPSPSPQSSPPQDGGELLLDVPLVGSVDVAHQALWLSTTPIAFVDGFNPCSLWVL
ncbi:MAG: hypothetical protein K0A98_15040, partial [Trueperaceae bacterium]|nr:hypothetical protein [Trueperaceae bacterium]